MTDDGWTSVPRGRKSRKPQPVSGAPTPSKNLTVEDINRDFDAKAKLWKRTQCRKEWIKQVEWALGSGEGARKLERYICIGSGSLSRDNVECRRRSMWQIVVFLDLTACLVERHELGREAVLELTDNDGRTTRGIWASDPAYTELDVAFLHSKGVEVISVNKSDPGLGNLRPHLGDGALLYEPFVDMSGVMIKDMIEMDVGLYIGSSIRGLREREGVVGELAKKFGNGKSTRKFPEFEIDPNIFDGIAMYWKDESGD